MFCLYELKKKNIITNHDPRATYIFQIKVSLSVLWWKICCPKSAPAHHHKITNQRSFFSLMRRFWRIACDLSRHRANKVSTLIAIKYRNMVERRNKFLLSIIFTHFLSFFYIKLTTIWSIHRRRKWKRMKTLYDFLRRSRKYMKTIDGSCKSSPISLEEDSLQAR